MVTTSCISGPLPIAGAGSDPALEHQVPVHEREPVPLEQPPVVTLLLRVDQGNRGTRLHRVVELAAGHHGPQITYHDRRLLPDRRAGPGDERGSGLPCY